MTAYDALTGTESWSVPVGSRDGRGEILPALDVVLTDSDGGIVALNRAAGSERSRLFDPSYPISVDESMVADGNLYTRDLSTLMAVDLDNGRTR